MRDGPRIAFVGAGRLGTVLALALHRAGYPVVGVASRSRPSAEHLASMIPGCSVTEIEAAGSTADVVFLTVPDDAISAVQGQLQWRADQVAVHCSGALPAAVLETAIRAGAHAAGFHPLQTFASAEVGLANLPGSTIGIEADEGTWPLLAHLAEDLGAGPIRITAEHRALYHAASALVSNGTVGLMAVAAEMWAALGIERDEAVRALTPLLQGTVRNIESLGIPAALTGPVVRGDLGTIQRHIEAIANLPRVDALYRVVSSALIGLALQRGTINADQAQALRTILEDPA